MTDIINKNMANRVFIFLKKYKFTECIKLEELSDKIISGIYDLVEDLSDDFYDASLIDTDLDYLEDFDLDYDT